MSALEGRAALVTGAASGTPGERWPSASRRTAWGCSRSEPKPRPRGPGEPHGADLLTREGNRGAVEAALERFGRLDAVVANAGFQHVAPVAEFPEDSLGRAAPASSSPARSCSPSTPGPRWPRPAEGALRGHRLGARARGLALQGRATWRPSTACSALVKTAGARGRGGGDHGDAPCARASCARRWSRAQIGDPGEGPRHARRTACSRT
ncbi:MAG: hypothetical protein WKF31_13120 [Thermoleophilaceae bacterium]